MSVQSEPTVRAEILAAGADLGINALHINMRKGLIPRPDTAVLLRRVGIPSCGWTLSHIRAWRSDIADRCAAILAALEQHPLDQPAARTPLKRQK